MWIPWHLRLQPAGIMEPESGVALMWDRRIKVMRPKLVALVTGLAIILSGCGLFGGADVTLRADFLPTALGFEIDDDGKIIIVANSVQFRNPPSGAEATITGYQVEVLNDAGTELLGSGSDLFSENLAIRVPPGYTCKTAAAFCELADRVPATTYSEPQPFIMVAGPVASHIVINDLVRARAVVTFTADWGGRIVTFSRDVAITYPVAAD
jgi:hypothetical protein